MVSFSFFSCFLFLLRVLTYFFLRLIIENGKGERKGKKGAGEREKRKGKMVGNKRGREERGRKGKGKERKGEGKERGRKGERRKRRGGKGLRLEGG